MVNTSDTYWSADGVSLQTLARNIETIGGSRMSPPDFRGEDIVIPYSPGEQWVPKIVGSRVMTLGMWIRGTNDNGTISSANARRQFEENWSQLRSLLWTPGRQFNLTKKFWKNGLLRSATAKAEYRGGLEPAMIGRTAGRFTVDLKLADPYFYDDELVTTTLVNGASNLTVLGDADTTKILVTINGSRSKPRIRNNSLGMEFTYNDMINAGGKAIIDIKAYDSTTTPSGMAAFDSGGKIRHAGAAQWLALRPGVNAMNYTSDSGAGITSIQHRSAWL